MPGVCRITRNLNSLLCFERGQANFSVCPLWTHSDSSNITNMYLHLSAQYQKQEFELEKVASRKQIRLETSKVSVQTKTNFYSADVLLANVYPFKRQQEQEWTLYRPQSETFRCFSGSTFLCIYVAEKMTRVQLTLPGFPIEFWVGGFLRKKGAMQCMHVVHWIYPSPGRGYIWGSSLVKILKFRPPMWKVVLEILWILSYYIQIFNEEYIV